MHKHRLVFALVLATLTAFGASAQTLREEVLKDPQASNNIYHVYEPRTAAMTPAPEGYTPFYISHYGRHGSRFLTGDYYFTGVREGFEKADSAGILSQKGKDLFKEFNIFVAEHDGVYGQLSPRGAREHRGISQRMFDRFTPVFNSKDRKMVHCVATTVPRCIISMANFATVLNDNNPSLDFTYTTGDKYYELLAKEYDDDSVYKGNQQMSDSLRRSILHYEKTFASLFTDPEKAKSLVGNPLRFINQIFSSGTGCQLLDYLNVDLLKYFDREELASFAIIRNNAVYCDLGNSKEFGEIVTSPAAELVRDFVRKADAAVEGNDVAADLRFGHDTGFLPFMGLIGIEGNDVRYPIGEASEHWSSYKYVCMASNFQMVFYHNAAGDVLVKLLYNEGEAAIKAVPAYKGGPYYKWSDLRNYLLGVAEGK